MTESAGDLIDRGLEEQEAGNWFDALVLYQRAAELDPGSWVAWYDAGLIHKWTRAWRDALPCFRRALDAAAARDVEHDDLAPIAWNLGMAATATGAWDDAFRAWRTLRMPIETDERGQPRLRIGPTPIRLRGADGGGAEVVWADRFDPVRARILVVPTPRSQHRWRDVVLHDADPRGSRMRGGRRLPVFDALERLETSPFVTWSARVTAPTPDDARALIDLSRPLDDLAAEDWSATLSTLCRRCSEGEPHEHEGEGDDDDDVPPAWSLERHVGLAARTREEVAGLLDMWAQGGAGRAWRDLVQAL